MSECIFCKIIKGEIPSYKIYEDTNYLAFLNISQFAEGQTLVIPKKHYPYVWDVEDTAGYFAVVQKIAKHFKDLGYSFVDMMVFGRDVAHAHVRLFPHNNDNKSLYKDALSKIDELERDQRYMLTQNQANDLVGKLKL